MFNDTAKKIQSGGGAQPSSVVKLLLSTTVMTPSPILMCIFFDYIDVKSFFSENV